MALRKIREIGDPILNKTCKEVKEVTDRTKDLIGDKFIQIYEAMWTPSTGTSGEAAYERESRNFNRLLSCLLS